jgi:hypothetical protein
LCQTVQQNPQHNQGEHYVRAVSFQKERHQRESHSRHRRRNQHQQPELDQRLRLWVTQAADKRENAAQLCRFGVKLMVSRRGIAPLREPPYTSRQYDESGNQDSRPQQRSHHSFETLVRHRMPQENPL